jgi:hypothetical protein
MNYEMTAQPQPQSRRELTVYMRIKHLLALVQANFNFQTPITPPFFCRILGSTMVQGPICVCLEGGPPSLREGLKGNRSFPREPGRQ